MNLLAVENLIAAPRAADRGARGLALQLPTGEVLGVVGANGAGKTTLLRAIAGVHPAAAGRVRFDGATIYRR